MIENTPQEDEMAYDTNEPVSPVWAAMEQGFVSVSNPPGSGPDELTRALRGELTSREKSMIGYSAETRRRITRVIELNPVLEEAILLVAELAYADGAASEYAGPLAP